MVLNELGYSITKALASMSESTGPVDEAQIKACLNEITRALMQADVNIKLVSTMINNVKKKASGDLGGGLNKRKIIEKAVFDELCAMLSSGDGTAKLHQPKKGKPSVVMFVGLQGSGKTTTCMKYAHNYKRKGYKPAMVCADTFRAGAFDQLKQNATKAQIPFYGSYQETDPAVIAQQGVERFKQEGRDLIIVDTSGRHKQEESLFEEMRQVAVAVSPDLVVFVMDGSIGQAAFDQAKAFKDSVAVGAVIITKMDGHAKGGGALSAVSATSSPIIFLGTGEHMDEFEAFEANSFVGRLLGRGDWKSFMDKVQDVLPDEDKKEEMMEDVMKGNFTMRLLYDQLSNIMKMGSVSQLMSLIPGFSNSLMPKGNEKEGQARMKKFMCMMDSMTDKELDSPHLKTLQEPTRIMRIARGSGRTPQDVMELLEEYKRLKTLISGKTGLLKNMPKNMKGGNMNMSAQQMARMMPPAVLKQMGGMGALQGFMKQMEASGMNK